MKQEIVKRLEKIRKRASEVEKVLSNPATVKDRGEFIKLSKEHGKLSEVMRLYRRYNELDEQINEDEGLLSTEGEKELLSIAQEEIENAKKEQKEIEEKIISLTTSKGDFEERNAIMEIRAGAGGDEACLFSHDLFRMYSKYAESKGWKVEIMNSHPIGLGGFKEIIFLVAGKGTYQRLKYESGVHRVQRIPVTESGGRIHTSTSSVAIFPEIEEKDIKVSEKDLKIDTFRSGGAGGQSVNKVSSAVRITHIPTGITVSCQDERSQYQNRIRAMKILLAKLYNMTKKKDEEEVASERKSQIGGQDRAEKIRTYNFPQRRVTDHRINFTSYRLPEIMEGNLDEIIDKLQESLI